MLNKDIMPDLSGKTLTEILKIFEGTRFKLDLKGNGIVKKQFPLTDENIYEVEKIKLEFQESEAKNEVFKSLCSRY